MLLATLGLGPGQPPRPQGSVADGVALWPVSRPGVAAAGSTQSFTWARVDCDRCADERGRSACSLARPLRASQARKLGMSCGPQLSAPASGACHCRTAAAREGKREGKRPLTPGHEPDTTSVAGLRAQT